MNRSSSGWAVCVISAAVFAGGCGHDGLSTGQPAPYWNKVPATAILEPAELDYGGLALDAESNTYRKSKHPAPEWIDAPELTAFYRKYFTEAELFSRTAVSQDTDSQTSEPTLVCRPRFTVRQFMRVSPTGAALTVGTAMVYRLLGGSDQHRYAQVDLNVDVLTAKGRQIATYQASHRSAERLVTDDPEQLGPLVSFATAKALEDVGAKISRDRDLLLRAVSADMTARGVVPVVPDSGIKISIEKPSTIVVRTRTIRVAGQVTFLADGPVKLHWQLKGAGGGTVPMEKGSTSVARKFSVDLPLQEGINKVTLTLQDASPQGTETELAKTEMAYVCVPDPQRAPRVRDRWAVVIGVSNYAYGGRQIPDLKFAARDAREFRDFLISPRSGSFEADKVLCLVDKDATAENVRHALFEFLGKASRNDLVVIFFSGHGMPLPGTDNFFMLCHDTRPEKMASTGFPMWDIDTALKKFIKAEHVVVFADACHAGVIADGNGVKGDIGNPVHQYLQRLALAEPGRLIFTASEAREQSFESEKWGGGHGVFTHFLLEGLRGAADRDSNRVVDVGEIVDYVRESVVQATDYKQHPYYSGQYDRDLPLAVAP